MAAAWLAVAVVGAGGAEPAADPKLTALVVRRTAGTDRAEVAEKDGLATVEVRSPGGIGPHSRTTAGLMHDFRRASAPAAARRRARPPPAKRHY